MVPVGRSGIVKPFAQLPLDGVAAFEGCVQASDWIGHGRTPRSDRGQHLRAGP